MRPTTSSPRSARKSCALACSKKGGSCFRRDGGPSPRPLGERDPGGIVGIEAEGQMDERLAVCLSTRRDGSW